MSLRRLHCAPLWGCSIVRLFLSLQEVPWDTLPDILQHRKLKILLQTFLGQGCFIDVITGEGTIPMISPETPQGLQGDLCPLVDTEGAVWVFKFQFISTTSHVSVMKLK